MLILALDPKTYVTDAGYSLGGEIIDADLVECEQDAVRFREKYPTMIIVSGDDEKVLKQWHMEGFDDA